MSAHNIFQNLFLAGEAAQIADPGASGTIAVDRSLAAVQLVSAASESRTLPRPIALGTVLWLHMKTDGGDITLTVTGGFNEDGDTTFTFSDPGQFVGLVSFYDGTNYYWRLFAQYSAAQLTPTEAAFLNGVTAGTGLASKALVLDASGNVTIPSAGSVVLDRAALAALGTNQATSAPVVSQIVLVTGSDGAVGVSLPAAATTAGPVLVVNTVQNFPLFVYPVISGNDQINGLAANAGFELGAGEAGWFTPTSGTQWYTAQPHNRFNAEVVTTTNVITAAENGKTFFLGAAGGFTSTLPAPFKGGKFTFIVSVAPTTAYIITTNAGANVLFGKFWERAGGAGVAGATQDTQNFVANQAIISDMAEYWSDGTNWYVNGSVNVAAGVTFAVT